MELEVGMEVEQGIHRVEAPLGERFVALHVLVGARCSMLVDTGIASSVGSHLLPHLDEVGVAPESIRYVVSTHSDFDHVGGNAAIRHVAPEAVLMCHELDRHLVEDRERLIDQRYGEFRDSDGFDETEDSKVWIRGVTEAVPVDRTVSDGQRFDLGGRLVEILHTPGHSPGHLAVHDLATGALCIGDAALADAVLTAAGAPAFPPTYRDVGPYLDTISRLAKQGPELLLTAHYPVLRGGQVEEFLDRSRAYVGQVEEQVVGALRRAAGPLTTLDLVRSIAPGLGSWPVAATDFLIFPVAGHLDRLREQRRISESTTGGRRTWTWMEGR